MARRKYLYEIPIGGIPPTKNSIPTVYDPETGQMVGTIPEVEVAGNRPIRKPSWISNTWNKVTRSGAGYNAWRNRYDDRHNIQPNPQTVYANQLYYNQYMDQNDVLGNNSRLPAIIDSALRNKEYVNKDGTLNQKGNAYILQQKYFGPGSHYYNEMDKSAIKTANVLFGAASAPYMLASFANAPWQTAGALGGSIVGSETGKNIGTIVNKDFGLNWSPNTVQTVNNLGGLAGGLIGGGLGYDWGTRVVDPLINEKVAFSDFMYGSNWRNPTKAEIQRAYPVSTTPATTVRYTPKPNPVTTPNAKTSLKFFERPSKLSIREKLGVPKHNSNAVLEDIVENEARAVSNTLKYNTPMPRQIDMMWGKPTSPWVPYTWFRRNGFGADGYIYGVPTPNGLSNTPF